MDQLALPDELKDFFQSGRDLQFDQSQMAMEFVVFKRLDELAIENADVYPDEAVDASGDPHTEQSGRYAVPVVSLIKECGYFDPFGLLLWVPSENSFATYDTEHDALFLIMDTTWTDIEKDPLRFLNIQWSEPEDGFLLPLAKPWERYPWYTED